MRRVTIKDVAKKAGVSVQTVSRAVNNKGEISKDTRSRILAVVEELGYRPNRQAQSMVTQRTSTIGFMLPDITNPFFPEVARGIQDFASQHDYNVLISNTDDHQEKEVLTMQSLYDQGVDGIITFSHKMPEEKLRYFADIGRPIVVINRIFEHPNAHVVIVDNFKGAELAIEHFAQAGHQHVGMLSNNDFSPSQLRRVQGFKHAVVERGLTADEESIFASTPTLQGGFEAAQRLLNEKPEITAIFCYNDMMALGAIRACRDFGRKVPQDIAIIGFDDIQLASMFTPSLSSVRVDKYQLGRLAMERLLTILKDPKYEHNHTIELGIELVLREST